ncbi:hypothetical protein V6N12_010420 [Hibiscus sabdariffa]|uniref:Uncharacterized protein n=1 Tax=Hibiscus sabdariffa TaxID=183260 RepID=A0ABR2ENT7_9ROSI
MNCLASRDWKHCSIFAVNREVLVPIAKPIGYFVDDPCKTLKKLQNKRRQRGRGLTRKGSLRDLSLLK